jgi:hypothetical protein
MSNCCGHSVAPELDVSEIAAFHSIYFEAMRFDGVAEDTAASEEADARGPTA